MKTMTKLGLAVIMFMATAVFNSAIAQKYGGSAYVHVKDDEGNSRVLNATESCNNYNESSAKSSLESKLSRQRRYNEQLNSQIYYSIDKCEENDNRKYGGSASVRVSDDEGNTRVLSATESCNNYFKSSAKSSLMSELSRQRKYNEEFISGITYDIDSCN